MVTPNRPDAICLTALRRLGSCSRSTSSPPSPVLERAAERVHRDGQRLVRLGRDRAVAHRAGREPLDDLARRFDLGQRHRRPLAGPQLEQAAQRAGLAGQLVHRRRVRLEHVVLAGARGVLQQEHRLRVEQVHLAVAPPLVFAADRQPAASRDRVRVARVGVRVPRGDLGRDAVEPDAADPAGGPGEVAGGQRRVQADRLEHLRAAVGRDRRDAHLGHDLQDALAQAGHDVVRGRLGGVDAGQRAGRDQVVDGLQREVRVDRRRAVPDQRRDVVDLAGVAGLDDERRLRARPLPDQMLVDRGGEQQRRDRGEVGGASRGRTGRARVRRRRSPRTRAGRSRSAGPACRARRRRPGRGRTPGRPCSRACRRPRRWTGSSRGRRCRSPDTAARSGDSSPGPGRAGSTPGRSWSTCW